WQRTTALRDRHGAADRDTAGPVEDGVGLGSGGPLVLAGRPRHVDRAVRPSCTLVAVRTFAGQFVDERYTRACDIGAGARRSGAGQAAGRSSDRAGGHAFGSHGGDLRAIISVVEDLADDRDLLWSAKIMATDAQRDSRRTSSDCWPEAHGGRDGSLGEQQ